MSGKLIVLVPIGESISLDGAARGGDSGSDEESSIICKGCDDSIPIRRYQAHVEQWYYSNIL
jgi:hypothetical protein